MTNEMTNENKMGTMPIPKLLISMSLPMIISMLVQALYNIVDSIFVAQLSENALTAVSLAFPIQNLMIALGAGTGVGINALLSRSLGEKRFEQANLAARNGIFLAIMSSIVIAIFGIFGSRFFFVAQTTDPEIVTYGTQYLQIVTIISIGVFMQIVMERLLQATGKTIYSMITQATGAIINIILDPIMIFGLFGFPRMEVAGAALATVIGQLVAALLCIFLNCRYNKELNINMLHFRPDKRIIGEIYRVGIPSIIMQSIGSVMTFCFNKILLGFSTTAAAVLGVYFKLQSFVFMPIFGMNNGMIPIVAYNYGARNRKRILQTIKLAAGIAIGIMILGIVIFQTVPHVLLGFFDASETMLEIGVPALRIISIHFVLAGYAIIMSSAFQALGNGVYSLLVSVCRQLLVLLPAAYILAKVLGLSAVWFAFPIAELMSVLMCTIFFFRINKEKLKPLDAAE